MKKYACLMSCVLYVSNIVAVAQDSSNDSSPAISYSSTDIERLQCLVRLVEINTKALGEIRKKLSTISEQKKVLTELERSELQQHVKELETILTTTSNANAFFNQFFKDSKNWVSEALKAAQSFHLQMQTLLAQKSKQ